MRVLRSLRGQLRAERWLCLALVGAWPGCGGKSSFTASSQPSSAATSTAGAPDAGAATAGSAGGADRSLQAGQCRSSADCGAVLICVEPGGQVPGGLCTPSNCSADADCQADGGSLICEPRASGCGGGKSCVRGCTGDTDSAAGQACSAARCVQNACGSDADCPTDFGCTSGACQRKSCASDASCSAYCVNGLCYSTAGSCEQGHP